MRSGEGNSRERACPSTGDSNPSLTPLLTAGVCLTPRDASIRRSSTLPQTTDRLARAGRALSRLSLVENWSRVPRGILKDCETYEQVVVGAAERDDVTSSFFLRLRFALELQAVSTCW
jgi:hypothetical protein